MLLLPSAAFDSHLNSPEPVRLCPLLSAADAGTPVNPPGTAPAASALLPAALAPVAAAAARDAFRGSTGCHATPLLLL